MSDQQWHDRAACRDMDSRIFFPDREDGITLSQVSALTRYAKRVCAGCPVRSDCLDEAMTDNIGYGVWGGLTDNERRRLRRGAKVAL